MYVATGTLLLVSCEKVFMEVENGGWSVCSVDLKLEYETLIFHSKFTEYLTRPQLTEVCTKPS